MGDDFVLTRWNEQDARVSASNGPATHRATRLSIPTFRATVDLRIRNSKPIQKWFQHSAVKGAQQLRVCIAGNRM